MQTAIVTGGSQGFGLALTTALIADGWTVITDARDGATLQRATRAIDGGGTVMAIQGDVSDSAHREALIRTAEQAGTLDLLINNASTLGASPLPALGRIPLDVLRRVFEVNVIAPTALTQQALPLLRQSRGSAVVMISSDAAVEAYEGWGGYGSSKAALDQIAAVLAAEEPGLHVYAFDPGDMRTAMHQAAFPGEDISDRAEPASVVPALLRLLADAPPSGRYRAAEMSVGSAASSAGA